MVGADVAFGVRVHGGEAGVPEEPDVLLGSDRWGAEEGGVDEAVRLQVQEVRGDGVEA